MGTLTITKTRECADGTHMTLSVTGDFTGTINIYAPDVVAPFTEDEKEAFLKGVLRLARKGRTNAQLKSALTTGLTVTI
ncbi:hypothetical protein R2083_08015 [Nitrosomonas sp. Is35]|uniref:hypothetical protein n=1 Tax=Nitrosomonas sp. Is35 TaxID=3080534 RepID=UPI00294AF088|nr:hypothetical protein [Nitrosomonas sp. Is35]MDV6347458.1 hypothetical protein [Nitrosomonas sp. Is35]